MKDFLRYVWKERKTMLLALACFALGLIVPGNLAWAFLGAGWIFFIIDIASEAGRVAAIKESTKMLQLVIDAMTRATEQVNDTKMKVGDPEELLKHPKGSAAPNFIKKDL